MSLWKYANPSKFFLLSGRVIPLFACGSAVCICAGLIWGFFYTPDDIEMGSTVKIIYLHVPSAFIAVNAWFMMLVASFIWLIRRHHVSALAAKAAAPVGLIMTLIALFTGAVWGQPMWGTWWVWDPRLTSFIILFFFYVAYISLWHSLENGDYAADLTSILCLVGSVFAVLSRYAVNFWKQGLHQGATLSLDSEENISDIFSQPLYLTMTGFTFLFLVLVLIGIRSEIRFRKAVALILRGTKNA